MNDGNDSNEPTTLCNLYTDNSLSYIVSQTDYPSLTSGAIYKFKFRAINSIGNSIDSTIARFAMADMALAPSVPTKDATQSSLTSIYLSWTAVADTQLPGGSVLGYILY